MGVFRLIGHKTQNKPQTPCRNRGRDGAQRRRGWPVLRSGAALGRVLRPDLRGVSVTDFLNRPRRLVCPHCTTTRDWRPGERDCYRLMADPHGPNDPFFGLPLWLQTPCCGHILWAYNDRHLATLESYVGTGLRERTNSDPKRGMPYRLPACLDQEGQSPR